MDANTYYLNEHLAKKEKQETFQNEWIDDKVKDLLSGECDPFLPDNVREALSEMDTPEMILFCSYLSSANKLPSNMPAQAHLADFMVNKVKAYWADVAHRIAQKEFDREF
jgi:hypothetical protein